MGWIVAADTVLVIHFAFVVFIVVGAVLIRWARWLIWPHLAALVYGAAIQAIGFTCPLTPLEKSLRRAAGETVYEGGFIGHYITPVLYPGELTISVKFVLVLAVVVANVAALSDSLTVNRPQSNGSLFGETRSSSVVRLQSTPACFAASAKTGPLNPSCFVP